MLLGNVQVSGDEAENVNWTVMTRTKKTESDYSDYEAAVTSKKRKRSSSKNVSTSHKKALAGLENMMTKATASLQKLGNSSVHSLQTTKQHDDHDVFGMLVARLMHQLPSGQAVDMRRMKIEEVIMEAKYRQPVPATSTVMPTPVAATANVAPTPWAIQCLSAAPAGSHNSQPYRIGGHLSSSIETQMSADGVECPSMYSRLLYHPL